MNATVARNETSRSESTAPRATDSAANHRTSASPATDTSSTTAGPRLRALAAFVSARSTCEFSRSNRVSSRDSIP